MLLFLLACAKAPAPTAPTPEPAEGLAPRVFDADGLRDGFVLGTRLRFRMLAVGQPPTEEEWTVTGHTAEGCTIRAVTRDEAGVVLEDEEGTSTWAELESHASFPAAATVVHDSVVTVPAGKFTTRRYVVQEEDGSVKVLHFATTLPGPPVMMEITKDGTFVFSMTLLERTTP